MILFHWHVGDANKVYLILAANRLLRAYKLGFRYTLFLGRPQSLLPLFICLWFLYIRIFVCWISPFQRKREKGEINETDIDATHRRCSELISPFDLVNVSIDVFVVFFEAPHRIEETVRLLSSAEYNQGHRRCVLCRKLTKLHEEFIHGTVAECLLRLESMTSSKKQQRIKGEFTVILGPVAKDQSRSGDSCAGDLARMRDDGVRRSEAVKLLTDSYGSLTKSDIYKLALEIPWG